MTMITPMFMTHLCCCSINTMYYFLYYLLLHINYQFLFFMPWGIWLFGSENAYR